MPWPATIPREPRMFLRRWSLSVLGVLWGGVLCLPLLLAACLPPASAFSRRVLTWERTRQERTLGIVLADARPGRGFFALTGLVALLIVVPVVNLLTGFVFVTLGALIQGLFAGGGVTISFSLWTMSQPLLLVGVLYGAANLIGAVLLAELGNWLHGRIDASAGQVSRPTAVHSRITELITTRRGVVVAIDDERRRIERDLHDGVQQNVVSLSVLIARARRAHDPEKAAALLDSALVQSQDLIDEMREVAWRVYPTALDEHGLASVLTRIADHCPVPVTILEQPARRIPQAVESAAYFVVREAVTNVVKHAAASAITIRVHDGGTALVAEVVDDGRGGADLRGGGLQGLSRRVSALDGRLEIISPVSEGTTVRAEIPYD
ncbi:MULTISPECIES: sensor histidine kinase [Brevibacterium]|uniref:histidine kinase n=1 Tax=Brevibacterium casei TaxID=33889 RepID=A0A7T3ZX58_9MICO|nr:MULTISPECIES: histidine kinase [Brevibacterium]QQB13269.1 hypothetical protein I6H47_10455 [Brevibacterium casei]